jgi:hypothetical protein
MKGRLRILFLSVCVVFGLGVTAQDTLTTLPTFSNNNGSSGVSFEVIATSAIKITGISNWYNTATTSTDVWIKQGAINGSGSITVSTANGWTQHQTGASVSATGTGPVFIQNLTPINVAAGDTVSIVLTGSMGYFTATGAATTTFPGAFATLAAGSPSNGFGGTVPNLGFNPRGFLGSVVVELDLLGNCANPFTNVTTDSILSTSAKIDWDPGMGNTSFWLEYGLKGFTPGTGTTISGTYPGTQPPVILTGLSVDTEYDYYIGEICNSGADSIYAVSPYQFSTTKLCAPPTNLAATNIGPSTADISWNHAGGANSFTIYYNGLSTTATASPFTLTNLSGNTNYDIYVVADCGSVNGLSDSIGPVSFLTPCTTVSTYPFTENFDGPTWTTGAPGTINQCWSRDQSTSVPRWQVHSGGTSSSSTGPSQANSGSVYLYLETSGGTTGSNSQLTLPEFDLTSLNVPIFSFYYHMYGSAMGSLEVQVSTDTGSTWTTVLTLTGQDQTANADPWKEELVDLTNYKTAFTMVRFNGIRGTSFTSDMAIDDIRMEEAPPCPKPTALSASNITSSSADISWLSNGTTFVVEYGLVGFAQGTGLLDTVTANTVTLTGLAGNTAYDVYVLNDCSASGNGLSVWQGPLTFTTLCNAFPTPFDEGFEGVASGSSANLTIPNCWFYRRSFTGTAPYAHVINFAGYPRTGSNCYRFYSGTPQTTNDTSMLISPEIADMDVVGKRIEFWAASYSTSTAYDCELIVGTVAGPDDYNTFVPMDTISLGNNTTYQYVQVFFDSLSGYNGTHRHIAIMDNSDNFDFTIIDDITISNIPSCIPSSNVSISGVTSNSAIANWTPGGGAAFQIEYGIQGFSQGTGPVFSTTDSSFTITNLIGNTCYDVYVRDSCSTGSFSPWFGPIAFCTSCDQQPLPITENFDNTPTGTTTIPSEPDCWTYYETPGATGFGYTYSFLTPNSTPNHWRMYNGSGLTDTIALISPAIQGFTNGDVRVKFFAKTNTTAYDVNIIIGTVPTVSDISSLSIIDTVLATQNYQEFVVYLDTASGYNGTDNHIVFMHGQGPSFSPTFDYFYLDDILIEQIPACIPPWNIGGSNITSSTIDLSWSSISGGTFQIEYGLTGFIQGTGNQGIIVNNTTSPHTLTGLLPGTTYDVYIADDCDTTNVTGPFTFTTGLDWDVSLDAIEVPLNSCGDSITEIKAAVTNNGINTITTLPITIDVTGGLTATISTTSTASLAPGASDTITVGSINTYSGGVGVLFEGYTSLANDQKSSNDTLVVGPGNYIPFEPQYFPEDTVCADVDSAFFAAIPIPGIIYGWYANATDTVPVASGDTFTFPMSGQQTWYLAYEQGADSLATTFAGGNGQSGNAFELLPINSLSIQSIDIHIGGTSTEDVAVYYFLGSVGTSPGSVSWILHETFTGVQGAGVGSPTNIQFTNPLTLPGGQVSSMVVVLTSSTNIDYTNGTTLGGILAQNNDLTIYEGWGVSYGTATAPVGGTFSPRNWNGRIYYGSAGCSGVKKSLTIGVNNDTAVASAFQATVQANGADVDFDASGSIGNLYTWDFGDGNSGTGMMTSHTYAAGGTYTVCLTVEDTVCGSIDSVCQTVVTTIGLDENLINQTMAVYPNPNNGNFRVEFQVEGLKEVELRVVSLLGQVMYESKPGNISGTYREEIDLSDEAAGVYVLQVISDDATISRRVTIRK